MKPELEVKKLKKVIKSHLGVTFEVAVVDGNVWEFEFECFLDGVIIRAEMNGRKIFTHYQNARSFKGLSAEELD